MELTRMQFDVLTALLERSGMSQRALQKKTGYSLGSVNKTLHELGDAGLVDGGAVSASGLDALEPYRVKRAVIIAAGFGSRLVPVTLNTPKPLVRVTASVLSTVSLTHCLQRS